MSEHLFRLLVGSATLVMGLAALCQVFIALSMRKVIRDTRAHVEELRHGVTKTIDVTITIFHENRTEIVTMAETASELYRNVERLTHRIVKLVGVVTPGMRFIHRIGRVVRRSGQIALGRKDHFGDLPPESR